MRWGQWRAEGPMQQAACGRADRLSGGDRSDHGQALRRAMAHLLVVADWVAVGALLVTADLTRRPAFFRFQGEDHLR